MLPDPGRTRYESIHGDVEQIQCADFGGVPVEAYAAPYRGVYND
jgi:hypothetical protein